MVDDEFLTTGAGPRRVLDELCIAECVDDLARGVRNIGGAGPIR